jgi:uncharacterized membrane protein
MSQDLHRPHYDPDGFGRFSENVARFMGSARFIVAQTVIIFFWVVANVVLLTQGWDPYPFICLNLVFSTQAAYAAPLILLAQSRQAERDKALTDQIQQHTADSLQYHARELRHLRHLLEHITNERASK